MNNYEITIVTPFHNIDINIFKNGFESLKNQTLGFEKIEYIIVLHNCEEHYITEVQELTDGYENVKTYILNNTARSASSPRNYGMELATARYIGFLDGDDSFTPWCLKTVLKHMKKTGAQLTWFRREYELESENSVPVTEIVLWDQTREEIIIEKGLNWDDEKIFSAVWGLVTSRVYDLEFLKEHNIKYDETVKLGEDYLFNFEVYGRAQKFCYLPQTIGYHYYINSGSIIQKSEKSEAELIEMAQGLKKIFDCGLKYGFYMDATVGGVTFVLARFMMGTSTLSLEGRYKIRELIGPYVEMIKSIKPSKIYSEKAAYDRSTFLKDYILNPDKWNDQEETFISRDDREFEPPVDQKVLNRILEDNAGTDMGKRYDFRSINTLKGFQAKVPITDYDIYEPLIALNTRIGESGIFVKEPITHYVYYTGTYGDRKILPVTASHIKDYVNALNEIYKDNITFLLYENVSRPFVFNDNSHIGSVFSAINTEYFKMRVSGEAEISARFTSPDSLNYSREYFDSMYLKCLFALRDENMTQICAPSMRTVIRAYDFIKKNTASFVENIANGTIYNLDRINLNNPDELLRNMPKNPQRADYLKKVFSNEFTLKDIWPNLNRIVANKTGNFETSFRAVRKNAGDVEFINGPILLAEMMLGNSFDDSNYYEMNLEGAFYEFQHIGDNGNAAKELIFYKDLIEGEKYRVYVTNKSGLYRYNTRLIVRIVGMRNEKPVFELLDGCILCTQIEGVNFYLEQLNEAMLNLAESQNISIFDFIFYEKDSRLEVLVELTYEELEKNEAEVLQKKLDDILGDSIDGYKKAREEGRMEEPELRFIEPETIFLYLETKAKKLDVVVSAVPVPHFVYNPKDVKFLELSII